MVAVGGEAEAEAEDEAEVVAAAVGRVLVPPQRVRVADEEAGAEARVAEAKLAVERVNASLGTSTVATARRDLGGTKKRPRREGRTSRNEGRSARDAACLVSVELLISSNGTVKRSALGRSVGRQPRSLSEKKNNGPAEQHKQAARRVGQTTNLFRLHPVDDGPSLRSHTESNPCMS